MARIELGTHVNYRGRLYVVVGVAPMSVQPPLLELEDADSGRIRQVDLNDPDIDFTRSSPSKDDAAEKEDLP